MSIIKIFSWMSFAVCLNAGASEKKTDSPEEPWHRSPFHQDTDFPEEPWHRSPFHQDTDFPEEPWHRLTFHQETYLLKKDFPIPSYLENYVFPPKKINTEPPKRSKEVKKDQSHKNPPRYPLIPPEPSLKKVREKK